MCPQFLNFAPGSFQLFCIRCSSKLIRLVFTSIISATALILSAQAQEKRIANPPQDAPPTSISIPDSTKEQDGLIGPVRRVRTERAELSVKFGKLTEGPRSLLSMSVYNLQGNSIDNTYYLVTEKNRSVGKQEYKYDDKSNVTQMTLRNNHGGILSREVYTYEFDVIGNWTKMLTSLVVFDGNKLSYEPTEVTYRNISYYFDEAIAKIENSSSPQATKPEDSLSANRTGEADADGHAIANEAASRSDGKAKIETIVPEATTVSGDQSADRMPKPQARLFSDDAGTNKVIMIPNAAYPDEAKSAGVTGTVAVMVDIDTKGRVVSARVVRGPAELRAAALEAALKARFAPTSLANKTSKRSGVITFTFSLIP